MFERLASIFTDIPRERAAPDGREAFAAVLMRAASADGQVEGTEHAMVAELIARRFGMTLAEASELAESGAALAERASDLVSLTRVIKDTVPYEERIGVIEAVWEVIYADGVRCDAEAALVRKLCGLLYVEDRDAGLARQRVTQRLDET
ncbi:TerB family tellurite resistance protein [Limibaculum sp. M0105]|uniref:TerB family tellurite resistance protein n=1 Tax=Thermohalobaculum xanthum TaxID=2753746 RepID=A0A8J7M4H4_9RHOB|nr:TerB family tellurite resistance protein [Thermohalobaculum xanthum]MBK0398088.1 TerB family tellurite resistance protein [Thermohalobaculum xanthum]